MKIAAAVAFGILALGIYIGWQHTATGCNIKNGRWASNGSYCITRDCYKTNSCEKWAVPGLRCSKLETGATVSEIYFQLGEPRSINGSHYIWPIGKAESGIIKAEIINGKLHAIECHTI